MVENRESECIYARKLENDMSSILFELCDKFNQTFFTYTFEFSRV